MKNIFSFVLLIVMCNIINAQPIIKYTDPSITGKGITKVHSDHISLFDPQAKDKHKLILMIEGTGDWATHMTAIDSCFATLGYHVISIDYVNNVITTVCSNSSDSGCFNKFREEIISGNPVSDSVNVDSTNSIVNRFTQLLVYLSKNDKQNNWNEFLEDNHPRWNKIISAGHSQGAGHAAYLGKIYPLAGVLMFSGPQDYLVKFNRPASWQNEKSETDSKKFVGFLHLKDPFNFQYQASDIAAVIHKSSTDTVMVKPHETPHATAQIFVNNIQTKSPHSSTIQPKFFPVWKAMLQEIDK